MNKETLSSAAKKAKNVHTISENAKNNRLQYMNEKTKEFKKDVKKLHVCISSGNSKMGKIGSVSLRPVLDCGNCKQCKSLCYDLRNVCFHNVVKDSRAKNAAIFQTDPKRYFSEIDSACKFFTAFRWHVGGDIVNYDYFLNMVKIARKNKQCSFLVFTKRYDIVNRFFSDGHKKPTNLQVIFSGWVGLEMLNPYNLPTSHPIFSDGTTTATDGAKLCTGDCSECFAVSKNCWKLKKGEQVVFAAH